MKFHPNQAQAEYVAAKSGTTAIAFYTGGGQNPITRQFATLDAATLARWTANGSRFEVLS